MPTQTSPDARVVAFHRLHTSGCFVMPNPWDAGSARALEQLGFPALATTSAGCAWTLGRSDNRITLDEALAHLRAIAAAVSVPVNAACPARGLVLSAPLVSNWGGGLVR